MATIQDFSGYNPTWCPGCGNYPIVNAIKMALADLDMTPSDLNVAFDIGCSGNMNDFLNAYAMHGLHGRAIPNAIGMKLGNHQMPVIAIGGDGGLYGEGGNHFLHAIRGNHDITVIVHDNRVYGLTTGQTSPTSDKGYISKSTPQGVIEQPVNALALALIHGATFIAQGFSAKMSQLQKLIKQAIQHKGFSLINILQPCVTFNKINTYQYYQQRVYEIKDYNSNNYDSAMIKAMEFRKEKFPLGVIYQDQNKKAFHQQIPQMNNTTLVNSNKVKLNVLRGIMDLYC